MVVKKVTEDGYVTGLQAPATIDNRAMGLPQREVSLGRCPGLHTDTSP